MMPDAPRVLTGPCETCGAVERYCRDPETGARLCFTCCRRRWELRQ